MKTNRKIPDAIYHDNTKLNAKESWRILGIMSEFVEATERLDNIRPAVSFFGSARIKPEHAYYQLTENIAKQLSDAGFAIVSGGGPGIMEAANKGGFFGKSPSIGLNISLPHEEKSNQYQDISINFKHFFSRKFMFTKYASAYVVLPGGFGTLDEFMETLTLVQTGKMRRLPILLVDHAFWQGLIDWIKASLLKEGTISEQDLDLIQIVDTPKEVVDAIFEFYEQRRFIPIDDTEILSDL